MSTTQDPRFRLFEHYLQWYGGFTVTEMSELLGQTRQHTSQFVNRYLQLKGEGFLRYDRSLKRYVPGKDFKATSKIQNAHLFLDHLRGQEMVTHYRDFETWEPDNELLFEDVERYGRMQPSTKVTAAVSMALRRQQLLKIRYRSRSKEEIRTLSPNRLIYAANRFHLRAYCHSRDGYRDFVLTRMVSAEPVSKMIADELGLQWKSGDGDTAWFEQRVVRLKPNPELPEEIQEVLARDFPMEEGELRITCNAATELYVKMQFLRLDMVYLIPQWFIVVEEVAEK